jgi:ankyrin repeat protein
MNKPLLALSIAMALLFSAVVSAQTAAKIDFARDVQPIFRQNCVGCHGPTQQLSGFRVDRKSIVLGRRGVVAGSSENSFLFHRITGSAYGTQMPPTGALKPEQIATLKAWIDQGAEWPDSLSNETERPPLNAKAVAIVEGLRTGDFAALDKEIAADPKLLNARGPEGSTPFMYAVVYGTTDRIERLLQKGADPNVQNDAGANALMWAATDLSKTRVLLRHHADVNARSNDMHTPLIVAARKPGNVAVVRLLLDNGANPNPNAHPVTEYSPLTEAALSGDPAIVELLLSKSADVKATKDVAIANAVDVGCSKCLHLLAAHPIDRDAASLALADIAQIGDLEAVRLMLDRGADVKFYDPLGRTALMYAAASDLLPLEEVKLLVERGADVNAIDRHNKGGDAGLSVLDIAKLHGETPIVDFLVKSGAKSETNAAATLRPRRGNTLASAIQTSLPLIQKADANFMPKAACASCHNNSFAAMAVGFARKAGFQVDEKTAGDQVKANVFGLEQLRDDLRQGFIGTNDYFGTFVIANILIGLDGEHHKPDLNTDAAAMYILNRQMPDGHWPYVSADGRPPICSDYVGQTTVALRALQLYAPQIDKATYAQAIARANAWLSTVQSRDNQDRLYRVMGLAWAGNKAEVQKALKELVAHQKADGGWSDLEMMESSAYTTGEALVAMRIAGVPATDAAFKRGVDYLLRTQQEDGSWYVKSRAMTFQPYFESGFPHGYDQWISAAGSSWAVMALSLAK